MPQLKISFSSRQISIEPNEIEQDKLSSTLICPTRKIYILTLSILVLLFLYYWY